MRNPLARVFVPVVAVLAAALNSCSPGGCYWKVEHFTVSPNEDCIEPTWDVCEAHIGITLHNNCSEVLVVEQGADDAGSSVVTIQPGQSNYVSASDYEDQSHHVSIPAKLGSIELTISWDIRQD